MSSKNTSLSANTKHLRSIDDIVNYRLEGDGGFVIEMDMNGAKIFKHILDFAKTFGINEITLLFTENGFEISQYDTSRVMLLNVYCSENVFVKYIHRIGIGESGTSLQVSMRMPVIIKAITNLMHMGDVRLFLRMKSEASNDMELLGISKTSGEQLLLSIPLLQMDIEQLEIPEVVYQYNIKFPSSSSYKSRLKIFQDFKCSQISIHCNPRLLTFFASDSSTESGGAGSKITNIVDVKRDYDVYSRQLFDKVDNENRKSYFMDLTAASGHLPPDTSDILLKGEHKKEHVKKRKRSNTKESEKDKSTKTQQLGAYLINKNFSFDDSENDDSIISGNNRLQSSIPKSNEKSDDDDEERSSKKKHKKQKKKKDDGDDNNNENVVIKQEVSSPTTSAEDGYYDDKDVLRVDFSSNLLFLTADIGIDNKTPVLISVRKDLPLRISCGDAEDEQNLQFRIVVFIAPRSNPDDEE